MKYAPIKKITSRHASIERNGEVWTLEKNGEVMHLSPFDLHYILDVVMIAHSLDSKQLPKFFATKDGSIDLTFYIEGMGITVE